MSFQDNDFRTWWAAQRVTGTVGATKHCRHALVGELVLDCDTTVSPEGPGPAHPHPGSETRAGQSKN
ncbi:hypothetical protein [Amycolatopsis sp.]|uniref:MmyB family transcriptional regulator n=1 Tax=Amycolatopsis sp. TaxID=37632 RepID=UPI003457A67B